MTGRKWISGIGRYKLFKQVIDNNTLTDLTLLIAQLNPKEKKEHINDLYMKLLNNHGSNVGMGYRISRLGL